VYHHYRRLIELRHTEPVVAHGDFTMLLPEHKRVYAFTRRLGNVQLLVLGNFSSEAEKVNAEGEFDPADWTAAELVLGNYPAGDWTLRPWEARVYRKQA
jgi:oligo-1,6-glucosidase